MSREVHVQFCERAGVRFPCATHLVILARCISSRLRNWVEGKLEGWLGLQINREKTRVLELRQPEQSLDFLGYTFRQDRDQYGRSWRYWNLAPSRKAMARERAALREMINPQQSHTPLPELIGRLNRHLAGWAKYFQQLGGVPLPVDEWGIDVCGTVINKCLACPPGVAPISVSPRAWEQIERKGDRSHGWYLNLETWRWYAANWPWHPTPVTLPTNNIVALLTSLRQIMEDGLDAHYAHFAQAAHRVREGLRHLGFEMFAADDHASPLITAVRSLPGMDVSDFQKYLQREHQILISGGLDDLFGKIFRVGHIGKAASPAYVEAFLAGVEAYLSQKPV